MFALAKSDKAYLSGPSRGNMGRTIIDALNKEPPALLRTNEPFSRQFGHGVPNGRLGDLILVHQ